MEDVYQFKMTWNESDRLSEQWSAAGVQMVPPKAPALEENRSQSPVLIGKHGLLTEFLIVLTKTLNLNESNAIGYYTHTDFRIL